MPIIRIEKTKNYSVIANAPFNDGQSEKPLSWEGQGMLAHLLTKPDNWEVNVAYLVKQTKAGRDKVRGIMRELEGKGYLIATQQRTEEGQLAGYHYEVHEDSCGSPSPVAPTITKKDRKPDARASKIDEEFKPNEIMVAWAQSKGVTNEEVLAKVSEEFVNYFIGQGKPKKDWNAAWRNWILSALNESHWGYRPALKQSTYAEVL